MTETDRRRRLLAFVDEAIGARSYVLAAVVLDADSQGELRQLTNTMLLPRQRRVHWHDESAARREKLAGVVAAASCAAIVVVGTPIDRRKQDRARRRCLERLVWELGRREVTAVIVESRQAVRDRADVHALAGFRRRGSMPETMSVEHVPPMDEPLLWYADIVAGAVLAARRGIPWFRSIIEQTLTEIDVTVN